MPGISTGRPNPQDYVLGRGALFFALQNAGGYPVFGYRDMGNVVELKVNQESQELEHFATRLGVKYADRSVVLSQKMSITCKLDEFNSDNLALWMSGTALVRSGYVGAAVVGTDNVSSGLLFGGRWYDIFKPAGGGPIVGTTRYAERLYGIGALTFTPASVLGTDYLVDPVMGRFYVIPGGNLEGAPATIDLSVAAGTAVDLTEVRAFTRTPLRGSLKFIQVNPANADEMREFEWHSIQLKADGEIDLIGDTWGEMGFKANADKNPSADANSPVCTVRTYFGAQGNIP